MTSILQLAVFGFAVVALMMFALWLTQLRTANAGIVDIGWAYGLGLLAILYGVFGQAAALPRLTISAMVVLWSARLGTHLFKRVAGKPEEGRYRQLRTEWSAGAAWRFLLFFEAQAILDVLLSLPFLLVSADSTAPASLRPAQFAGIAIWIVAVAGESLADAQLDRFKRRSNHGQVCREGLWNYSRHPNYFFEWLVWIGWALFALPVHRGWLAWSAPVLMLFFLLRVTGIPATEQQLLRSKDEAYIEYQKTTSPFVPWFPRQARGKSA